MHCYCHHTKVYKQAAPINNPLKCVTLILLPSSNPSKICKPMATVIIFFPVLFSIVNSIEPEPVLSWVCGSTPIKESFVLLLCRAEIKGSSWTAPEPSASSGGEFLAPSATTRQRFKQKDKKRNAYPNSLGCWSGRGQLEVGDMTGWEGEDFRGVGGGD